MRIVTHTDLPDLPLLSRGKVRDIYEVDEDTLLIITTDRMSAFDVVMNEAIPYKGVVLNLLSLFWMQRFAHIVPNHIKEHDVKRFPAHLQQHQDMLEGRSMLVHKAKPLPMECIVRGYLTGSGLADYQQTGTLCGHTLPKGLVESAQLPQPLFTPSTKAELGEHDENITTAQGIALVGEAMYSQVADVSLRIFAEARAYAASKGIIIADTKFEFGLIDGTLTLIDEALTPDSSRFWPASGYAKGKVQPSFDKQYLRDWLAAQAWDKTPPPPALPQEVIAKTQEKYREAYTILTGQPLPIV